MRDSNNFLTYLLSDVGQVSCGGVDGHARTGGLLPQGQSGYREAQAEPTAMQSEYQASPAGIHFVEKLSSFVGLKNRTTAIFCTFFSKSGVSWRSVCRSTKYWVELMRGALAPLRRVITRELEVFRAYRSGHPESFAVHDRLECGHTHTSLLWDVFDLLNAYTQAEHVKAVRHRCAECKALVSTKKQPQSVKVAKVAVA